MSKKALLTLKQLEVIKHSVIESSCLSFNLPNGAAHREIPLNQFDAAHQIIAIDDLIKKILENQKSLFSVERIGANIRTASSVLGREFRIALTSNVETIRAQFPIHTLSPYFELFAKHRNNGYLDAFVRNKLKCNDAEEVRALNIELNRVINAIREEGRTKSFKDIVADSKSRSTRNYRNLKIYIDDWLTFHSKMLLLNMDVGYVVPNKSLNTVGLRIYFNEIKEQHAQLIKYLKKNILKGSHFGSVVKYEYGVETGYRAHILLLLNASVKESASNIIEMLGHHWNNVITKYHGYYYNRSANSASKKHLGTDVIDLKNKSAFLVLIDDTALFMTKTNDYIKLDLQSRKCTFLKGQIPKKPPARTSSKVVASNKTKIFNEDTIVPKKKNVAARTLINHSFLGSFKLDPLNKKSRRSKNTTTSLHAFLVENLNPTEDLNMFTKEQQLKKKELLEIIADLHTSEHDYDQAQKELQALKILELKHINELRDNKAAVFKGLCVLEIGFGELMKATHDDKPIFTNDMVKQYVIEAGLFSVADQESFGADLNVKATGKVKKDRVKSDTGCIIFTLENTSGKGKAPSIGVESKFPPVAGKAFINLFNQSGDLKDNLLKLQSPTPEAQAFLTSADGPALVDRWVNWIKIAVPKAKGKSNSDTPHASPT